MKIYVSRPISGCSYEDVVGWYDKAHKEFESMGYKVLQPMTGKKALRNEIKFKAHGYGTPSSTNHAIFERDKWMTEQCDVFITYLAEADIVSIGSMMELAWASLLGKHTIAVMKDGNIHKHAFVLEAADIVLPTYEDAILYLSSFINQDV